MIYKSLVEFKQRVKNVMIEHPETRNDDTLLIFHFWKESGFDVQINDKEISFNIEIEDLDVLPKAESIRRCRAEIQNRDNELLPTRLNVASNRRICADTMKKYYQRDPNMLRLIDNWYTSRLIT